VSAFDTLLAAGVLREQADRSDLVGTCPVCKGAILAPIIGDGNPPRVLCANGCAEDAMLAAASSTGDAAWLTEKLDLATDPIIRAERWGRHLTAPIDLVCASGRHIRFDEQRDLARPQVLASTVRSYTDGTCCPALCSGADAQEVLAVVLRLCAALEIDESIAEASSWMAQFLSRHQVISGTLATPEGYWRAIGELRSANYDPTVMIGGGMSEPPVLADTETGLRYVRCADVGLFVRRRLGVSVSPQRLRAEMKRAGYEFRELQKWQPGTERHGSAVKLHTYVVPSDEAESPAIAVPPNPCVPPSTHTRAPAHTRREGGTQGYRGTETADEVAA